MGSFVMYHLGSAQIDGVCYFVLLGYPPASVDCPFLMNLCPTLIGEKIPSVAREESPSDFWPAFEDVKLDSFCEFELLTS